MDQVTNLITGRQCFALSLAKHFGDELPENKQACGHCTWCETQRPVELKKPPQVPWDSKAFAQVLLAVPDRDDARFLARVAFGIGSPRVTSSKLSKSPVFGSMEGCSFVVCFMLIFPMESPDTDVLRHCSMRSRMCVRRVVIRELNSRVSSGSAAEKRKVDGSLYFEGHTLIHPTHGESPHRVLFASLSVRINHTVAPQSQSSTEYTFAFLLTRIGPTSIQLTLLGTFFPLGK
jgi:hypothetical protein